MVARPALAARVRTALGRSPVTLLVGPRQCGKTTLAGVIGAGRSSVTRFDLERPADLLALEAGGASAGPRMKGTAAPDACDIKGARLGVPGTVVTDLLDRGGFAACLHKATNREALACVAETAARLAEGSDRIDPTGAPIWLVPKTKPQPWTCSGELGFCSCDGNDDCVDLILFGPCEGGTMVCDDGDVICICYFPD